MFVGLAIRTMPPGSKQAVRSAGLAGPDRSSFLLNAAALYRFIPDCRSKSYWRADIIRAMDEALEVVRRKLSGE